jgi:PAS domain-containing protein
MDGRVVLMNPVAEGFSGVTQAQAAGRLLAEVLPLRDEVTRERRTRLSSSTRPATSG